MRRAWKMYEKCYAELYGCDMNTKSSKVSFMVKWFLYFIFVDESFNKQKSYAVSKNCTTILK